MKLRKLSGLRYAFCGLDFFWRRGPEARVTFARGLILAVPSGRKRIPSKKEQIYDHQISASFIVVFEGSGLRAGCLRAGTVRIGAAEGRRTGRGGAEMAWRSPAQLQQ